MGCRLRVLAVVALGLLGCGDDATENRTLELCMHVFDAGPEAGPEAGVASGCPRRQVCDTSSVEPRCICQEGYEGTDCASCERGWSTETGPDGGVVCDPLPINCATRPCGMGGECVTIGGTDRCNCDRAYEGRLCSRCAFGFQDNDGDGECVPGCRLSGVSCPGRRECSDLSGEAECVCIEGFTGDSCDVCASGYRETGAGGCLATCAVAELECGAHGACADLDGPPRCVCDVGYGGTGCSECAETHREDGMGACIGDPPDGYTLLATATGERGEPILGALRPGDPELVGLTMLDRSVSAIAWDDAAGRLFGVASSTLVEIDPHYGGVTDVVPAPPVSFQSSLAWDGGRGVLYALDGSGALLTVDPTTGTTTTVVASGALGTSSATLAYDPGADAVLGASSGSRFSVSATTGAVDTFLPLGIDHPVERLALAVEPSTGALFAVADGTEGTTERLAAVCREIAAALRYPVPDSVVVDASGEPDPTMPGQPIVLTYAERDPPLVVYSSYGDRSAAPRTLRVATSHPDAVVCVVTYEEVLHVVVDAAARFHFLVLVSYEPTLTLEIEDGFTPKIEGVPPIRVHVSDEPVDPSLLEPEAVVRFYDGAEWSAFGLTLDPWSSGTARLLPVLMAVDWPSGAVFERPVEVRSFLGGLAPYGGAP